ncbi:MAG: phospholipase D family protein [Candidatus Thermoplasmatota archaeon]
MAKFLNTRKAVAAIEDLIKNADAKLILISPFLRLSKDFKELLIYRNNKDKITTIIFRKEELQPDEMQFLESLRFVILKSNKDLHAKCYVNDKQMIITSLNLYESSMTNNKEMGILLDIEDINDKILFEDAYKEIEYILNTSQNYKFNIQSTPYASKTSDKNTLQNNEKNGYCIRCGTKIPLDPDRPYCLHDFQTWNIYGDSSYVEHKGFCHICGKPHTPSKEKPVCVECFRKNPKLFPSKDAKKLIVKVH